jgi:DNA-binding GntR family transcriptional regulator
MKPSSKSATSRRSGADAGAKRPASDKRTGSSRNKVPRPGLLAGVDAETDAELSDLPSGERAYKILTHAIARGELKGGMRWREAELGQRIGLSRTPVREALARLEEQGLVVNDGSRGLVVAELDHRAVSELYAMREVLEGTAARLAAQHSSEVEIAILRKIVERNAQLTDPHDLAENNRLFHGTLYRCSHNRYLLKMLRSVHEAMLLLGQTALASPAPTEVWMKEHKELMDAIERRDADGAERIARNHIAASFRARLASLLSEFGKERD